MLIKTADDQSKRVRLLEDLQQSDRLDARQREWLVDELRGLKTGRAGEDSAAHYLDMHHRDSQNVAVLHDLRLSIDGQSAQIDHLLMARAGWFFLLETKNFGGNLRINEHGEFSVRYSSGREFGIPSPLEQSKRHEVVLRKVLTQLGIQPRIGEAFSFHHVVLVHPRATITRPPASAPGVDTSMIIKADQFVTWREKFVDQQLQGLGVLKAVLNMRSSDSLREDAEKLARQHRPTDQLALPEWMAPKAVPSPAVKTAVENSSVAAAENPIAKKLICATCGVK
ncbi:MAG: nuclease-related domain-containing protein, partial [Casimicrobium sp.]